MALKIGIVGLPNVGKSTLFNALTKSQGAQAANYPFCTIDPNVGMVEVPDERMHALAKLVNPERVMPTAVEFVDIAGLVKGASEGEGLGNKFLSHIRECDAIAQVLRFFEDGDVTHVHGNINPKEDKEVIEMELILADMQTLDKRLAKAESESKSGDKAKVAYAKLIGDIHRQVGEGKKVIDLGLGDEEKEILKDLNLLTAKPFLYIANVHEDEIANDFSSYKERLELEDHQHLVPISAKIEADLSELEEADAKEYLTELGIEKPGLHTLIQSAYNTLDLMTYFTAGPKEVRAWTVNQGSLAPQAAGKIHTDFEKGFIRAEVIGYDHFVEHGGEAGAKEKGKMRMEGKDYIVKDGDVMHFHFNN